MDTRKHMYGLEKDKDPLPENKNHCTKEHANSHHAFWWKSIGLPGWNGLNLNHSRKVGECKPWALEIWTKIRQSLRFLIFDAWRVFVASRHFFFHFPKARIIRAFLGKGVVRQHRQHCFLHKSVQPAEPVCKSFPPPEKKLEILTYMNGLDLW